MTPPILSKAAFTRRGLEDVPDFSLHVSPPHYKPLLSWLISLFFLMFLPLFPPEFSRWAASSFFPWKFFFGPATTYLLPLAVGAFSGLEAPFPEFS